MIIRQKFVATHTAEVTCDKVGATDEGDTYYVTAEGLSEVSLEEAETKAIQQAEFIAAHKLYEDCGCDDGVMFTYTHTIENEPYTCDCDDASGVEITVEATANSRFSVCDATIKATAEAEYQLNLAKYEQCRNVDGTCAGYFSTYYASQSCNSYDLEESSGSDIPWVIRRVFCIFM